jgi:hypothetical protein
MKICQLLVEKMSPSRPVREVALELRDAMDDLLPEGVGVIMNTSEIEDGTGSVRLTITTWPSDMNMLNRERIVADRQDLLMGKKDSLHRFPLLSTKGKSLAESLQKLLDEHFPPVSDSNATTWPVNTDVMFDEHALERERISIIHSTKNHNIL